MVNLNDIKNYSAILLLEKYEGINPYLKKLKYDYLKNKKLSLTENQSNYILNNHDKEPIYINKIVQITPYLGEELKTKENVSFVPEKILIEFILAETDKNYHVYGKLKKNQSESKMYWLPKTQVIDDPYFDQATIEIDFSKYNEVLSKTNKKLYQHQEEAVKFLLERKSSILAHEMGLGKEEFVNNQVFTPNGRKRIGSLKVGDKIIGSNGNFYNVTGIFPQGTKNLYRVTFSDGYSVLVGSEHLWHVFTKKSGTKKYKVLTTNELLKDDKNKWQIPIVKPINFTNEYDFLVSPYLFGFTFCDKNVDVKTNKIPNIYKYSSIENRIALLQGLMDKNGRYIKNKKKNTLTIEYLNDSEELIDDVAEIIHSLGGLVKKKIKTLPTGTFYILKIYPPKNINLFKLQENLESAKTKKIKRYITKIELDSIGEAVCISVDAPDKLYVTEHAIVTHNTTTSIVAALESGANKILVVCPSSAKINWQREINMFCDEVSIVEGRKWKESKFTIINFDILKNFHTLVDDRTNLAEYGELNRELANAKFDLIIVDEAHYLKNNNSIRGKIISELSVKHNVEKVWLLTGTPIANRPMDFFNLLKIIKSPIANNWQYYAVRYCEAKKVYRTMPNGKKRQFWLTDGASNLEELSQKTKNNVLRKLKKDVLDMPDKVVVPMYYKLDEKASSEYYELWEEYVTKKELEGKSTENLQKSLVELILLRKFIAEQSIPYTIELVENAIENGKKVIIFTSFTDELRTLAEHFGKIAVVHNGEMSIKEKQKSVDNFQNKEKIKVFIGNIKSAGVAITLTEASVVVFNSFSWVPGDNQQCEERAFRIGQKNDVTVYYQLFEKTISIKMWNILNEKQDVISTIMGEKEISEEEVLKIMSDKLLKDET